MPISDILKELFARFVPHSHITSSDEWYKAVKPAYPEVTRAPMRAAWNAINKSTGYRDVIPNLPAEQRIPWQWGRATPQAEFDKWTLKFTWTAEDKETGATWQESFFYTTDKLFSRGKAEAEIGEDIAQYCEQYDLASVGFTTGGFYRHE